MYAPGVGASEYQTHLNELAVDNVIAPSLDVGGVDTHRLDVAVTNHLSSGSSSVRVV